MAPAATSQVRVGVRIRPLTSKESSEGGRHVVSANAFDRAISLSKRKFTYDSVFHSEVTQCELYDDLAPPLLDAFLNGYNATVLAYGQTGSGKTYTMGSEAHGDGFGDSKEGDGLIPRFMADIFAGLIRRKEKSEKAALQSSEGGGDALVDFGLSASFLEVYGEDIHDLLDEDRHSLPLREDSNGEVVVKGLRDSPIASAVEAMDLLNTGTMNRTTASTLMNRTSSRSHAVFTVNLRQVTRGAGGADDGGGGVDVTSTSRFTFVDLAGSERMKKTGAEGERAREGIKINEGLLALGNVINALADEERLAKGERIHVPYRQSKLTRLLQDALGGNSQTLFMACVSPSGTNASETLSTLQYANRARNIRNAPTRNVDATVMELARLRTLTNLLKCELIKQRFDGCSRSSVAMDPEVERSEASAANPQEIGVLNEALLKRDDVVAYMKLIDDKVTEMSGGGSTSNLTLSFPTHSVPMSAVALKPSLPPSSSAMPDNSGNKSVHLSSMKVAPSSIAHTAKQNPDKDALILDVNPEEDMQIIDQLLELQQQDQQFQEGQKVDQDRLDDMEGEIAAQEGHLLQLREHLQVYHSMKDKYERLMCEVHSLEGEKQTLAEELEKAQVDPAKGCSQAIKKKLAKVEEGLARARSETRRHQQMYRQAEAEAQKCKVLERKIHDLKHNKVNLIRKQREDAAKHKEFTNQKTKEIHALKRREKKADKKISKMEMECQKFKSNLERSKTHCDKLSDKLKQTESHLMQLLTKRRNDLNRNKSVRQSRARGADNTYLHHRLEGMDQFAPVNEEAKSICFLLEKSVSDRVTISQSKDAYESKVIEHGKLMQTMAKEAKLIHERRREYQTAPDSDGQISAQIGEHEDTVQELQLEIELLESDMEQLRAKCPSVDEENSKDENGPMLKMMTKLDGPMLRTLLSNLLETYFSAELQRRTLKDMLERKESTLESFENEISMQNEKLAALTKSLDRRRRLATSKEGQEFDPFDMIQDLENEVQFMTAKLKSYVAEQSKLSAELEESHNALSLSQLERAQVEERLTLLHSQQKLTESTEGTEQMLMQLQGILAVIGISTEDREIIRQKLETCVEDAVNNALDQATQLRDEKSQQVNAQKDRLDEMYAALGLEHTTQTNASPPHTLPGSLNSQLDSLDRHLNKIQPQYDVAVERCNQLGNDFEILSSDLHPIGSNLSDNLHKLMQNQRHGAKRKRPSQVPAQQRASLKASREARAKLFKNVEHMMKGLTSIDETAGLSSDYATDGHISLQHSAAEGKSSTEPGSLSALFLDHCERDIKKLRLVKSERLLSNDAKCSKISEITKTMHVGSGELSSIILHGLKKQKDRIPRWWDRDVAKAVYDALSKKGCTLVSEAFTNHLSVILDTIEAISNGRQLLSDCLKTVLKESHSVLIATAEGCGMDVGESQKLHDALFHLPPLSKEHVKACIDEMEMLITATETVSQSEIETLTVLWEGLNVSSNDRGQFWGELDQLTSQIEMSTSSPFDIVLEKCPAEVEEWVLKSSKDATRAQRMLGIRVFKLNKIHEEVERLKRKQDAKNGIMSLNNELKLLSAKLADFEQKAGNKQRLLNKKVNSSSLLEEERFRKQMQGMVTTKLESLRQMLNEWEKNEGCIEDDEMLSEVVKSMQLNSHRIEAWMKEKTRLMHLKTTNPNPKHRATLTPARAMSSIRPKSGSRSRMSEVPNQSVILDRPNTHMSKRFSTAPTPDGRLMSQKSARSARSAIAVHRAKPSKSKTPPPQQTGSISLERTTPMADCRPTSQKSARTARSTLVSHSSRPKSKTPPPQQVGSNSSEHQKRKALSSSSHNTSKPVKSTKPALSIEVKENDGSPVLLPFGNLLAETPKENKNNSHF